MFVNPYLSQRNTELTDPIAIARVDVMKGLEGDITTPYCSTFLGNRFYPLECRITKIDIEDIANGLAYQCRFNGQTNRFFSVAEHSLIVSALVPDELKFAALMHDAGEAYLGDWVKPIKILFPELNALEEGVTNLIVEEFGLDFSNYAPIKRADNISLATEKRDLMPNSTEDWSYLDGVPALARPLNPMDAATAKVLFLQEYHRLNELRCQPKKRMGCRM